MKSFKLFWNLHKWLGIGLSAVIVVTSVTGFTLLIKKKVDWIQPPTQMGVDGDLSSLRGMDEILGAVLALDHPDFQSLDDIDRVDFRPGKRVHKVRSKHHHAEVQVDAVSGELMGVATRRSDLFEQIHDGSFFAGWVHNWFMPVYSVVLLFMVFSGFWLWLEPKVRRRRRLKRQG